MNLLTTQLSKHTVLTDSLFTDAERALIWLGAAEIVALTDSRQFFQHQKLRRVIRRRVEQPSL